MVVKKQQELSEILDTALREHAELQEALGHLLRFHHLGEDLSQGAADTLAEDLRRVRSQLEAHFRWEETAGLFDDLSQRMPQEERTLRRLRSEHTAFLKSVDGLLVLLAHDEQAQRKGVWRQITRFVDAFLKHEERENQLLQDAHNRDWGAPD